MDETRSGTDDGGGTDDDLTPASGSSVRLRWWTNLHERRSLVLVGSLALSVRVLLYLISPHPLFFSDSGEYLEVPHRFVLPYDRPIGVSVFYKLLLEVWHDLRFLVIGQSLLGVASAVLAVVVARMAGVKGRFSTAVGVAVALSPALLVYERTMLAEALTVFLTILATLLFLSAFTTGRYGRAIIAGLTVGLSATVRTSNAVIGLGLVLVALWAESARPARTRVGLAVALTFGAVIPVIGYSGLNYVDSWGRTGQGTFAMSNFDGIVLFARVAPWTDCSEPERPPDIRAEVCAAGPAYLESGTDPIVWSPGPVNSALASPDVATTNAQLRALALETIAANPVSVIGETLETAWADLTNADFRYPVRAIDGGYAGVIVERYFGPEAATAGSQAFGRRLQDVYAWWTRVRPALWLALAMAIVAGFARRGRPTVVAVLGLGVFVIPVVSLGLTAPPLPRYLVPYEFVAFIGAAWITREAWTSWWPRAARWRRRSSGVALAPEPEVTVADSIDDVDRSGLPGEPFVNHPNPTRVP